MVTSPEMVHQVDELAARDLGHCNARLFLVGSKQTKFNVRHLGVLKGR